MTEVYDNAKEVFKELFDTGQGYEAKITELTQEKLSLSEKLKEMKTDFVYNLDIIKELETKVRDCVTKNESISKKYNLVMVELSDAKVMNKQLEDRLLRAQTDFENCKTELNSNQRLHNSLVTIQQKNHYNKLKAAETDFREELKTANEKIQEYELTMASKLQANKITIQQDLSKDRHEWNKKLAEMENQVEMTNLQLKSKNLELESCRKQIETSKLTEETLADEVKSKLFEINSLKLLVEEERSITADYTNQANQKLKELEMQNTNSKYEADSKLNLLDKQLRIRKLNLAELKMEFENDKNEMNKVKLNLETLLHQEQLICGSVRNEMNELKEQFHIYKTNAEQKRTDAAKKSVEFGLREEKMLNQIQFLQKSCDDKDKKIANLETMRKESLSAFKNDVERAEDVETKLRIQIQRLKSTIKEMKYQMQEMTSDEERRLLDKKMELEKQEAEIIKQRKEISNITSNNEQKSSMQQTPVNVQLATQLKKSIEEAHVLKAERDKLLERCNKLQATIRKLNRKSETEKSTKVDMNLSALQDLQYDLTKQQLGLIALRKPYRSAVYELGGKSDITEEFEQSESLNKNEESFLDSEISCFPDLDSSSNSNVLVSTARKASSRKLPPKPKSSRKDVKPRAIDYNALKQKI